MSEEFDVRGAHEELFDEAAEREPKGIAGQLAVMTAILATVGAMFSYMAGATQAEAHLAQERRGDQEDGSLESVELLSGKEWKAEPE